MFYSSIFVRRLQMLASLRVQPVANKHQYYESGCSFLSFVMFSSTGCLRCHSLRTYNAWEINANQWNMCSESTSTVRQLFVAVLLGASLLFHPFSTLPRLGNFTSVSRLVPLEMLDLLRCTIGAPFAYSISILHVFHLWSPLVSQVPSVLALWRWHR